MFPGESCGWGLSWPKLWARDRRPQLRADPSGGSLRGAFGLQPGCPQADQGQPDHDETPYGLHRFGEGGPRENHHQRSDSAVTELEPSTETRGTEALGTRGRRMFASWSNRLTLPLVLFLLLPLQDT